MNTLPALSPDKDRSLQEALGRLSARAPVPAGTPGDEPIVTAMRRLPPVEARFEPFPDGLDDRLLAALAARGISRLYSHQAEAVGHVLAGRNVVTVTPTASGKTLCYNLPVLDAILRDRSTRALYLFPTKALAQDQLAELHELSGQIDRGHRSRGDRRLHLRRRHAAGRAPRDPRPRARGAHQPRHAALGHPAAPPAVGEAVREPEVRRHRRAARLPRRVRQPPRQHLPPARAGVPPLRLRPDVHLLVGDHRQPAGAGGAADGEAVRDGVRERRAARREVLPRREPAGRERRAGHPALVPRPVAAGGARVPAPAPPGHRLRAEPAGDRDPHDLPEGRGAGRARRARPRSRLPRRLPAAPAARDRARPARRHGARRRLDQRARAGHRHRRARRRGAGGLPGHDRRHLAAGRPRRAPDDGSAAVLVASSAPLDQFIARNPATSSTARPSTRWSTPTTCTSCSTTSSARRSSCRSRPTSGSAT